jgi:hypothetical protein
MQTFARNLTRFVARVGNEGLQERLSRMSSRDGGLTGGVRLGVAIASTNVSVTPTLRGLGAHEIGTKNRQE